jgi:MFS family permease
MINSDDPGNTSKLAINLVAICFSLASTFVVQTMLLITVSLLALELGASLFFIGLILSVPYLLPLVLAIPFSGIITRAGGKIVIITSGLGMVLGPAAVLALPGFSGLIVAQIVVSIVHMAMILAGQSIVSSLGTGKKLEKYFGWYTTCLSAGQLVGPILAGWIIDSSGITLSVLVIMFVSLLSMLSGFFLTGSTTVGHRVIRPLFEFQAQAHLLKENVGAKISIALTVAVVFALSAYGTFLPIYLKNLAVSATMIGTLVSLRALFAMLVRPFMPLVIKWVGGRSIAIIWSPVLVAFGFMLTGMTDNLLFLSLLAVLIGLGSGVSQPLSMVVLVESVNEDQRSGALAVRLMANRGVQFLAPLSFGALAEVMPFSLAFLFGGAFIFVFVGLIAYMIRSLKDE